MQLQQAFNFENEQSVLDVKQALQEKEGIQVDQIRLVFIALFFIWIFVNKNHHMYIPHTAAQTDLQRKAIVRKLKIMQAHNWLKFIMHRSDEKTLASYNVAAGETIHMVLSLRGGR